MADTDAPLPRWASALIAVLNPIHSFFGRIIPPLLVGAIVVMTVVTVVRVL